MISNNLNIEELSQQERTNLATLLLVGNVVGGPSGGSWAGGSSPTNTPTTGTPIEIQLLLSAIPYVEDGQVIRSEHHNLLRAALVAIAARLGVSIGGPVGPKDVTLTLIPTFYPGLFSEWRIGLGIAAVEQGNTNTQGWLPVELPDGALIKSMTVFGRRDGAVSTFSVALERQDITEGDFDDIITINLANSAQIYNVKQNFQGTPGVNEVDNSKYKYLIDAVVTRLQSAGELIQIYAIQVVYTTTS